MGDTDEDIDMTGTEEEDWIQHMKRSTRLAEEKMRTGNTPCWIMTHKKMKWRLATRIFSARDKMVKKKKQQNGIRVSAMDAKEAELWEDRENYGKTTSINSSSLKQQRKPMEMI